VGAMKILNTAIAYVRAHVALFSVLAVGVIALVWLLGSRGGGDSETLLVKRGDFLQEVSVSGTVIAAREVDLGFTQSGRVSRASGKVGDRVAAGALLAALENGDLRASVKQKEAALEREKTSLAIVKEGTRPEEIAIARSEVESDEVALRQAREALIDSVQDAFTNSDDSIRNTLDQFIDTPSTNPQIDFIVNDAELENRVENERRAAEVMLIEWQEEVGALAIATLSATVSNAQAHLSAISLLLTDANAALNKAVPTGSITQTIVDGYKTDIATARSSINSAISSLTSAITAEKSAVSALATSQKNLALKQAGSRPSDVLAQEADVKAAAADLLSAQAQLAKTLIVAPFSGLVTKMDVKVGEIASPNTSEITLMSQGAFQIESFVPEINVALLSLGDTAHVTLDAYGDDAIFEARVISIDPAQTVRDGVSTYRVRLQFDGADPRIRVGMTANVRIVTDTRENVISIPQGLLIEREGKYFVRVDRGGEGIERQVSVGGVSSLGNIEITSGLSEGDIVILSGE